MAKKKKGRPKKGEQLPLIETIPEQYAKKIAQAAGHYEKAQKTRLAALEEEVAYKNIIRDLVKEAELKPLEDGVIRFKVDGLTISITPRDELIKVKHDKPKKSKSEA